MITRILGLPAFAVELRFTTADPETGRPVEHIQIHKPFVERVLAVAEFARLLAQGGDQFAPDTHWRLVLLNLAERTVR